MSTMVSVDILVYINGDVLTGRSQVKTPYVNHVATMTGGIGYDDLARFYKVIRASSISQPS